MGAKDRATRESKNRGPEKLTNVTLEVIQNWMGAQPKKKKSPS
jgi:hypothetical protein